MNDTKLEIAYGSNTYPDNVEAIWSARLIWPNDLVWNRQDITFRDNTTKNKLLNWLNGERGNDGAFNEMRKILTAPIDVGLTRDGEDQVVIYEDDLGIITGSAQGSRGYVYVCGYLKVNT